jgi:hypothetical protein
MLLLTAEMMRGQKELGCGEESVNLNQKIHCFV